MMPQEVVSPDIVLFKFWGVTRNERGNIRAFKDVEDRGSVENNKRVGPRLQTNGSHSISLTKSERRI
jgi:hypothetical protein